ncbi:uncharacterized protein LOC116626833 [Phoca vitulina]|uniref:uncharacterized protein LOC116626833 n=1 Tax=Phoca vitulina TaxID=9720 RepID=UPI001395FA72|nr:uncharacterized protein LOC116626833 [Phoca vitulina]
MGTDQRALLQPETSGHSPPTWQTERKLCALDSKYCAPQCRDCRQISGPPDSARSDGVWVVPWTLRAAQGRAPGRQPGDRLRHVPLLLEVRPGCVTGFEPLKLQCPRPEPPGPPGQSCIERTHPCLASGPAAAPTSPEPRGRPKLDATSECGAEARWTVSWTSTRGSRQSETRRPAPSALSPHGLRGFEKGDAPALGRATLLVQEMHLLWGEPRSLSRRRTCCGESHAPCPGDAPAVGRATVFVKLMHLLWGEPRSFSRRRTCCGESHAPCPGDAPAGGRAVAHCSSLEAQQESWAR